MLDGKLQSIQRGTRMCVPKLVAIDAKVIKLFLSEHQMQVSLLTQPLPCTYQDVPSSCQESSLKLEISTEG